MSERDTVIAATPLRGLRGLVLDTETTGLQVDRDRIISVGAVRLEGAALEPGADVSFLVDPGRPIPAEATRIHGLHDADVAGADRFEAHIATLDDALEGRVVIGHNIGFDLAVLAHEYNRAGLAWTVPPALDTGLLARALNPHLPDITLETVADWLDVAVADRHSALGDARTTAQIYLRLLPRLANAQVRTLGEAERFMIDENPDAARHHALAGWQLRNLRSAPAGPPIDTFAYRYTLADLMSSPAIFIDARATLADAAARMAAAGISAVLVENGTAGAGIVTERDIVTQIAESGGAALALPVADLMTSPVVTLPAGAPVYRAVGRLQRLAIRHIAVTGADGRIAGMVSARDLLRRSASAALVLGDEIAVAETTPELARAFAGVPDAARRLRAEELAPARIAGLISAEARALTERAAELAVREIGAAPAAWSLVVLGSAGRGESLLAPDQDNALIHADRPGMANWALAFGRRVNEMLDAAGLPLCRGGVMAGQPDWCRTPQQWRDSIAAWVGQARPRDLLNVDIFYDMRHVAGAAGLADNVYRDALTMAQGAPSFVRALTRSVAELNAPVGPFGRLRATGGRLDIKAGGLLPVVAFARAAALRHGIAERATVARLGAAAERGALPPGDRDRLIVLHGAFMALAMDQQLADIAAGEPPTYRLDLRRLGRDARHRLAGQLSDLDDILSLAWSTLSG